jgi:hypothetical protein
VYPTLAALPAPADLVVVAVPAHSVANVAREAAATGARVLVVISSGFSESGAEGAAREAELLHVARTSGLRVVGPNCLGIAVTAPAAPFDATFGPATPPPGRIALVTQSGSSDPARSYRGGGADAAMALVAEKVRANTAAVLDAAAARSVPPREVALELARERVVRAMSTRRWW